MDTATALKGVQTLQTEIPRGARVDLTISGAGLEIEEPMQSLIWQGEPTFAQFLVTLPGDSERSGYHPVIRMVLDGKLVGRIVFHLAVDAAVREVSSRPSGERAGPYTYAFVSYAAEDRKEVLKRVQMLDATRTAFFQDVLSLDPGARWTKELYRRIDKCDLFLLFWSSAAKRSEWVIREAEYALARQERDPLGRPRYRAGHPRRPAARASPRQPPPPPLQRPHPVFHCGELSGAPLPLEGEERATS